MRDFWDARARESALYFVDNRLDYRDPDLTAFWAGGEAAVDGMLALSGVEVGPTDRLLEIGCGVGRMTRALATRAGAVVAIDVSAEMLAKAGELNPGLCAVEWVQGDGTSLAPIADRSIDGCVSLVVFQHLPDPSLTLGYVREIGRVLRPGGWAAIHISNDAEIHRRHRAGLASRAREALGLAPRGQRDPAWVGSAVDLEELRNVATEAGMTIDRINGEGTQFCVVALRRHS